MFSIVSGIFRDRRRGGEGDESALPEVFDMDELERRLREARTREEAVEPVRELPSEEPRPSMAPMRQPASTRAPRPMATPKAAPTAVPQASPTAGPTASPPAVPSAAPTATPTTAASTVRSTVRPSALASRTPLQPSWAQDSDDVWDIELDDADWEALEGESAGKQKSAASRPRTKTPPREYDALPEPIGTFAQHGHPWQAAFVVSEVLGPPRALSPYRVQPRG